MRIGIDGRELKNKVITGTGRPLLNFLKYAPRYRPDWEFIIFTNQHAAPDFRFPNLKIKVIPEHLTLWWDQVKLPYYIKKEKIDLFFSPYYKGPFLTSSDLIVTIFDLLFLKVPFYIKPARSLYNFYLKNIIVGPITKKAKAVITCSRHSKKDIAEILNMPQDKIKVIPLSADDRFRTVDTESVNKMKTRYGLKGKYMLYVGVLAPHKNIQGLIEAYSRLSKDLKQEYRLVIAGRKTSYYPRLLKLTQDLKIGANVTFTDFFNDADLPALYSGADLFIFPSFYEGFGLPPLEAMACGTPVIASDVTSLPEVIGDAGIMVDPKDIDGLTKAMGRLLTDAGLKNEMRERGLKRAKLFQADEIARKILNTFEEIKV